MAKNRYPEQYHDDDDDEMGFGQYRPLKQKHQYKDTGNRRQRHDWDDD